MSGKGNAMVSRCSAHIEARSTERFVTARIGLVEIARPHPSSLAEQRHTNGCTRRILLALTHSVVVRAEFRF